MAIITTVIVFVLTTAYFIYVSLGQRQELEQQSKTISLLALKLTNVEDRLAAV